MYRHPCNALPILITLIYHGTQQRFIIDLMGFDIHLFVVQFLVIHEEQIELAQELNQI